MYICFVIPGRGRLSSISNDVLFWCSTRTQHCDIEELSTLKVFVQNKGEEGSRMVFYSVGPQPKIGARWVKDDSLEILYPEKLDVRFPPSDDGTANVFEGITARIYKSDGRS